MAELLDDPTVTQQDMAEMSELWEDLCVKSVQKQERLDEALEVCVCGGGGWVGVFGWVGGCGCTRM